MTIDTKDVVIEAIHLKKYFPVLKGFVESIFQRTEQQYVHAVDDISFRIYKGETFGLVGESGCGKSTTGHLLLSLLDKTSGQIYFKAPETFVVNKRQKMKILNGLSKTVNLTNRQKARLHVDEHITQILLNEEQINEMKRNEYRFDSDFKNKYLHNIFKSYSENKLLRIFYFLFLLGRQRIRLSPEQQLGLRKEDRIDISETKQRELKNLRTDIQIVFQNPYESLSPRFSVLDIIAEPLRLLNIASDEAEIERLVIEELESVGLRPARDFLNRHPHELSGGQRQRVGVARAFILDPEFIVADEPVSMLDVSVRVGVLKIMRALTKQKGTSFLFITHDLALARIMCERIAVMYLGRIVELGETEEVVQNPKHPYTKALIAGVPKPDPDARRIEELPITGEVPSGISIPSGCRFHPRCPYVVEDCKMVDPQLEPSENGVSVACIRSKEINKLKK